MGHPTVCLRASDVGNHRLGNDNILLRVRRRCESRTEHSLRSAPLPDRSHHPDRIRHRLHAAPPTEIRLTVACLRACCRTPWSKDLAINDVCRALPPHRTSPTKSTPSSLSKSTPSSPYSAIVVTFALACHRRREAGRHRRLHAMVTADHLHARNATFALHHIPGKDGAAAPAATIVHGEDEVGHQVYAAAAHHIGFGPIGCADHRRYC